MVAKITAVLDSADLTVAVAESLTGGMLASKLAAAPGASKWFRGAVVAYVSDVEHQLLGVGRQFSEHGDLPVAHGQTEIAGMATPELEQVGARAARLGHRVGRQ